MNKQDLFCSTLLYLIETRCYKHKHTPHWREREYVTNMRACVHQSRRNTLIHTETNQMELSKQPMCYQQIHLPSFQFATYFCNNSNVFKHFFLFVYLEILNETKKKLNFLPQQMYFLVCFLFRCCFRKKNKTNKRNAKHPPFSSTHLKQNKYIHTFRSSSQAKY